ncbi:RNA polymerase sigma-70 factor [soil metagenome]
MASLNLSSFEKLFKEHFKPLCSFAKKYVKDQDEAKGIVHDVFVNVWDKKETIASDANYSSYLFTAVRNRCLNHIRDNKKIVRIDRIPEDARSYQDTTIEAGELEYAIELALLDLPEKCREVFELSRLEGLKYAQIAEKMKISEKTVEAQITKALRILRDRLGEFMGLLFFIFGN